MNRWTPERLRHIVKTAGLMPKTIIDVGVGYGTPKLYEAFPDQDLLLLEPLQEYDSYISNIFKKRSGKVVYTAVGAEDGEVVINLDKAHLQRSSVGQRREMTSDEAFWEKRTVKVSTLDSILAEEHSFNKPYGLKIDTEGFEIEVIKGASNVLKDTSFVIAEISVVPRFKEGYGFADFIKVMDDAGFKLFDILDINPPGDVPPPSRIIDGIFVKK